MNSFPGPVKSDKVSPTACHRFDISSELEAVLPNFQALNSKEGSRHSFWRNTAK